MSEWRPINSKALKADMFTVAGKLGIVISDEMGILFGLLFDGWSHGTMHFVGSTLSTWWSRRGGRSTPAHAAGAVADGRRKSGRRCTHRAVPKRVGRLQQDGGHDPVHCCGQLQHQSQYYYEARRLIGRLCVAPI